MAVNVSDFGSLKNGKKIEKYTICNINNVKASVITYGATLSELLLPDRNGLFKDILVSFDDIEGFEERSDYQGVIVGPYANRIGNSKFFIDDTEYRLTANEKGVTCLHSNGEFNVAVWSAQVLGENCVEFGYISPDGLNGFPGNTEVKVKYTLTDENELKLEYYAVSDKKTVINLTNHSYFNLGGFDSGTILGHEMMINADKYIPVDSFSIPTGEIADVDGTPFDFRTKKAIGADIDFDCDQLNFTGGFDHNFCIKGYDKTLRKAAEVTEKISGRKLEVYTDLPGVQFYAGNFLNGEIGKAGKPMVKRIGFCLETQYYPDTPNNPDFPQCTFEAGEAFTSETLFKFSVE